ncbi:RsmB/NOP family class I SAM-dependent RNA methyltransferase [Nocardioides cynanchi]|uniref:RsmB/NOP family class I SAM-dependent RNA methyltransferase n=1 Tax=Nocardioides cynanchi TaxID=2558918 RepID=UPI001EE20052|nr:transcription antitermination factor NusB [Nocardioides cynanchi]
MSAPDPARRAAYDVLRAVRVADAYTNLALPVALGRRRVTGRDAAFATELASGTIRRRGTYDAILGECIDRPLDKVQVKVLDILRLGCHQLLSMRVPPHAAISTSVDLARAEVGDGAAGFVNAVLRKVSARDVAGWLNTLDADRTVRFSHPQWIVDLLTEAVGAAEIDALLAADNESPAVTLVARPGRSTRDELPGEPTRFSPYGVVSAGGDPGSVPAVAEGRAGVQDEGSQLVAVALAGAPLEGPDRRWLDLCAGPGGKAALLAALAAEREARLVAAEVQPHRADLVRRVLGVASAHPAPGVEAVTVADGTAPPWEPGSFDRVLVDAPCSGLGALRRRPEARWHKSPDDLAQLVGLQVALLTSAVSLARPGGVVVYATCSPVLAETAGVVTRVLDASRLDGRPEVTLEPMPLDIPDSVGPLPGTVQLWPHRHRTDAMFVALLRRT